MRAHPIHSSLHKLGIHNTRRKVIDTAVDNPPALLTQPWLFLRELEDEVEDLCPRGKRHGGLEKNGGLDNCFSAEEATEMAITLFLYPQGPISTVALPPRRVDTNLSRLAARGIGLRLPNTKRVRKSKL